MNLYTVLCTLILAALLWYFVGTLFEHLREKPSYDCEHDMRCEALVKHGDTMKYVYICKKCGHTKKFRL